MSLGGGVYTIGNGKLQNHNKSFIREIEDGRQELAVSPKAAVADDVHGT